MIPAVPVSSRLDFPGRRLTAAGMTATTIAIVAIAALAAAPGDAPGAAVTAGTIELVESFPVETDLDLAGVANAQPVWLEMIRGAERSIEVFAFYVSTDPDREGPLRPVLAALREAGGRGVRVRILADAGFHRTYPEELDALGAAPGVEVRLLPARELWGGVLHAKGMVVDGRELFLGSQNWDWRALQHIRELGVRVGHAVLAGRMTAIFDLDWGHGRPVPGDVAAGEDRSAGAAAGSGDDSGAGDGSGTGSRDERHADGGSAGEGDHGSAGGAGAWAGAVPLLTAAGDTAWAVLAASPPRALPPGVPWDLPLLIETIDAARRSADVQLLSYGVTERGGGYWDDLDAALRRAAARGVRVRMLLSNWAKRPYSVPWLQSLAAVPNVEVRFSNIPPWSGGFVPYARVEHAKLLEVDGERGWVGTSNWSRDYFEQSRNLGLFFRGAGLGAELRRWFETGWEGEHTEPVSPCGTYEPPRIGS